MRGIKKAAKAIVSITMMAALFVGGIGCGDSSNNDQGVAFTFLGWFADTTGLIGITTAAIPLSGNVESSDPETGFPGFTTGPAYFAGLQNNMTGQFIRVDRMHHEYYVPGASTNPPDTSVGVPVTLGPAPGAGPENVDSSLPGSLDTVGNVSYAGAFLLPANVREFMVINKNQFPEPPFILVVTSYASGVTSSGQRFDSNRIEFEFLVEPDVLITPTPGTGTGPVEADQGAVAPEEEVFE